MIFFGGSIGIEFRCGSSDSAYYYLNKYYQKDRYCQNRPFGYQFYRSYLVINIFDPRLSREYILLNINIKIQKKRLIR